MAFGVLAAEVPWREKNFRAFHIVSSFAAPGPWRTLSWCMRPLETDRSDQPGDFHHKTVIKPTGISLGYYIQIYGLYMAYGIQCGTDSEVKLVSINFWHGSHKSRGYLKQMDFLIEHADWPVGIRFRTCRQTHLWTQVVFIGNPEMATQN